MYEILYVISFCKPNCFVVITPVQDNTIVAITLFGEQLVKPKTLNRKQVYQYLGDGSGRRLAQNINITLKSFARLSSFLMTYPNFVCYEITLDLLDFPATWREKYVDDATGVRVTADKPIAVISGKENFECCQICILRLGFSFV